MPERLLDVENIGRIGQMFIDGDLLKDILIDRFTCDEDDTNYNIPAFNKLKAVLSKVERMNPDKYLSGVIWYWYPANRRMAAPAIVGRKLPETGWMITDCDAQLAETLAKAKNTVRALEDSRRIYYFPIKTSSGDVVGALELTEGGQRGTYETRSYA